jgi:hypothetical protein
LLELVNRGDADAAARLAADRDRLRAESIGSWGRSRRACRPK